MLQASAASPRRTEFQGIAALSAIGTLLAVAFGLSTLITPLYLIYKQQFGFSQLTLTLIYAAYVIGNVGALLFFGRISDHVGRRLTALSAIATLLVAVLVFLFAKGVAALYIARILSGLGIGISSSTGNAWLAELVGENEKSRAAIIGTSTNFLGLGLAPLLSGLLAEYAPWPLRLSFIVYLIILCAVAAWVWFANETIQNPDLSHLEFRPRLSVPQNIRTQFIAPAITGFALMALVGFYAALMPSVLAHDLHVSSHAAAGALFFELATVVAVTIIVTQTLPSRTSMILSLALMIPAVAALVAAQTFSSLWLMLVTTAVVAISAGLGYRGSLQVVNEISPSDSRAAIVSSYFVSCFAGNALPVIGVGVLSSLTNATTANIVFACMIGFFAAAAIIFGLAHRH